MTVAIIDQPDAPTLTPIAPVSLGEAFWVWLRIAALSFGADLPDRLQ
ncbi:MAG: hypothetical protein JWL66_1638 [Sphingomonadales bacterium]|nr:hypothetical protein [Sphingomonadales bacterium]